MINRTGMKFAVAPHFLLLCIGAALLIGCTPPTQPQVEAPTRAPNPSAVPPGRRGPP